MKLPNLQKDLSLSETVYRTIYEQILSGKLHPNDRLTEQSLSQSMGISRAPIREALKRLKEDRLIVLMPRSGCYVASLSNAEIEEIYEIRKRLEGMALEYAFTRLHVDSVKKLYDHFLEIKCLTPPEMARMEVKLDARLHGMIIDNANCPNLREMLEKLRARVEVFRIRQANYTQRAVNALEEHLQILKAILEGNLPEAVHALQSHIENTKINVLSSTDESL